MPKRVKQQRRSSDINQIAHQLVERSTADAPSQPVVPASISEYMASIGRKGGKVGGKRRMKTMTAEQRAKIAKKAAQARWGTRRKPR